MSGAVKRVLKWHGYLGSPMVIAIHPDEQICMAAPASQGQSDFFVWATDRVIDEAARNASGWKRVFHVAGTGHPVPANWVWRASWINNPYVWHLFEEPQP